MWGKSLAGNDDDFGGIKSLILPHPSFIWKGNDANIHHHHPSL